MKSLDDEKAFEGMEPNKEEACPVNPKADEAAASTESVKSDSEAMKDIEMGAGILQTIGRLLRKNGGKDMGGEKNARLTKEETETTTTESSVAPAMVPEVSPDAGAASPGMGDTQKAEWPEVPVEGAESEKDSDSSSSDSSSSGSSSDESTTSTSSTSSSSTGTTSASSEEGTTDESTPADLGEVGDVTPEEEEAARVLMSARARREQIRKEEKEQEECEEDVVREIAILLSKARKIGAGSRVEKEAMSGALWNVRYLLAKNIMSKVEKEGKMEGDASEAMAKLIADGGPYASTEESAGKPGASDDKQSGETDMARSAVTAADKQPTYAEGEEKKEKAPTAKESAAMVAAASAAYAKLPQASEVAEFGKSMEKVEALEKSVGSLIEKAVQASSQMVLKATTEIAKAQKEQFAVLSARIEALENGGAVSKSGPRGAVDGEISKSTNSTKTWGGLFGGAAAKAISKM
jgi:hypothetical protein